MSPIEPFRIDIPQADLDDLHERLVRTRFPEQIPDAGWDYGTELGYLRELVTYWRDSYDWRATEARLNELEHFTTEIDGQSIHFIHARSPEPDALPLVMTHGWPGSIVEFLDVIGPLSDPVAHGGNAADAFHVVAPSLPGYAFSGPTHERGWHQARTSEAWAELMKRLGYERYVAQGGDWGSFVTLFLATADPEHVAAIHVNMLAPNAGGDDPSTFTPEEAAAVAQMGEYLSGPEGAYYQIQSGKPQTLGYALEDSPAGLCAWIVEKFRAWSDCDGDVERSYTKDQLLDNVMLYWLTGTAHSSVRYYYEFSKGLMSGALPFVAHVDVPTGYALYPREIMRTSERWAARGHNLVHYAEMPRGGHFAAMEVPDLFVDDVRAWGRKVRS